MIDIKDDVVEIILYIIIFYYSNISNNLVFN